MIDAMLPSTLLPQTQMAIRPLISRSIRLLALTATIVCGSQAYAQVSEGFDVSDEKLTAMPGQELVFTLTNLQDGGSSAYLESPRPIKVTMPDKLINVSWTCTPLPTVGWNGIEPIDTSLPTLSTCAHPSGIGDIDSSINFTPFTSQSTTGAVYIIKGTVAPQATAGTSLTFTGTTTFYQGDSPTPLTDLDPDIVVLPKADLSTTLTDNATDVKAGTATTYTLVVSNTTGPDDVLAAIVEASFPSSLTGVSWTCTATGGATCPTASGTSGTIHETAALPLGASLTYTVTGTVPADATGTLTATASVANSTTDDPDSSNNTASKTTNITAAPVVTPPVVTPPVVTPPVVTPPANATPVPGLQSYGLMLLSLLLMGLMGRQVRRPQD